MFVFFRNQISYMLVLFNLPDRVEIFGTKFIIGLVVLKTGVNQKGKKKEGSTVCNRFISQWINGHIQKRFSKNISDWIWRIDQLGEI